MVLQEREIGDVADKSNNNMKLQDTFRKEIFQNKLKASKFLTCRISFVR